MTHPIDQQTPPKRATFLVEHYWPGFTAGRFRSAAEQVRAAAAELAAAGTEVRFLHSTLVLDDEAAFCVFETGSQAEVEQAYHRAGVSFQRLLDALEMPAQAEHTPSNHPHPASS